MEREKTIIKWTNKRGYCRIAFKVDNNIFLLIRDREWGQKSLFNINQDIEQEIDIESARKLWELLINEHDFEEKEIK